MPTRSGAADVVKTTSFALACDLDPRRFSAGALRVDFMLASIVQEGYKPVAGQTFYVRPSSIFVSVACPGDEFRQVAPINTAKRATRSRRIMWKYWVVGTLDFDSDHRGKPALLEGALFAPSCESDRKRPELTDRARHKS